MLAECVPGPAEFGAALDLPAGLAGEVLPLVRAKLAAEPVEDLRLDFEDGYGDRGDAAEDAVHAAPGRLIGLHYGTYDYSASLGIAAGYQSIEHPAADYARAVMQVAAAGTGVRLSDGSTSVFPAGGREDVLAGWRLHARLVRRSLERGFYQGWDLHPAQLVSRYAATYAFYREGLPAASDRLRGYASRAAFGQEEPATARALAGFLLRGLDCGAFSEPEIVEVTGLDAAALRTARRRGVVPDQHAP